MITISIDEIERDLLGYLRLVQAGETVVVVQGDQPVVELRSVAAAAREPRPFGLCAGEFRVPDDFDAPLPSSATRSAPCDGR